MSPSSFDLAASDAALSAWLRSALGGDEKVMRDLVVTIAPVIQSRVARALLRRRQAAKGRNLRQELEDMVQEVFASLLSRGGRSLLAWDPTRGLSFERFVGFLAEREVAMIMRTGKRSPWTEDPTLDETMVWLSGGAASHEDRVASREILEQLGDRLREQLSPKGRQCFQLLFVEARGVEDVSKETGMSTDALYAWRSRLAKLLKQLQNELVGEEGCAR